MSLGRTMTDVMMVHPSSSWLGPVFTTKRRRDEQAPGEPQVQVSLLAELEAI